MKLATQCIALLLPAAHQQQCLTRRSALRGAVASFALPASALAVDASLGSNGISSYEKLKLDTANKELAEGIAAAQQSVLKTGLDAYATALKSIADSQVTKATASNLDAASSTLKESATGGTDNAALLAQVASIEQRTRTTSAACVKGEKGDPGPAAVQAAKLADELTDLAYAWTAAVRPLQEVTSGQPGLKPAGGYVENFSGLGTRKGGML